MSLKILREVFESSRERGSSRLVLLTLAFFASDEGWAWPRVETLAGKTLLDARQVRRILRRLVEAGEIRRGPHPQDRRRTAYRLVAYLGGSEGGEGSEALKEEAETPSEPTQERVPEPALGRLLAAWEGLPREVERPSLARLRRWLGGWPGAGELEAALQDLRRRGALEVSLPYVEACLRSARARGRVSASGRASRSAWEEELRALADRGTAPQLDVPAHLARLGRALTPELPGPRGLATAGQLRERLRSLEGDVAGIEAALEVLDREMLDVAQAGLSEPERQALQEAAVTASASLARRLPPEELAEQRTLLARRLLRRRLGLPVLSLWSPTAQGLEPSPTPPPEPTPAPAARLARALSLANSEPNGSDDHDQG